ncbi:hypothetical protein [Streptomyces sp. NPDC058872]|uniref:hypothetical protein n=1 Tax=Streptomyces sp. NPDC058872 TaxID=3346661 RepID=UPI00369B7767
MPAHDPGSTAPVPAAGAMTAPTGDEHRASADLDFPRPGTVAPASAITVEGPR